MKFLFDFFPLIAFYAAYQLYKHYYDPENAIFAATAAIIVATLMQVSYSWIKHRKIEKMHIITAVLVSLFGGLTLALHDPLFIKWKVSIVNWLFALFFIGSHWIGDKTVVERMLAASIQVPRKIWSRLNASWALFFITMGLLNIYVFTRFDEETWVGFKVYGMLGLTFVFVVIQGIYLSRHIKDDKTPSKE